MLGGIVSFIYGIATYLLFLVTFLYAVAFVGDLPVPRTIDNGGPVSASASAIVTDLLLLGLFAIQHSVMARRGFKRWWTRYVPPSIERTTYVLFASLALLLLYWQWRPIPAVVWTVGHPANILIWVVFWLGWAIVLLSTFLISHFELFGLAQVYALLRNRAMASPVFKTPFLYRWVRHPLYLGFLLAFWASPRMTYGHALFTVATTGYILIGIFLEERDLIALFGDRYRRYRAEVSMLFPLSVGRAPFDAATDVSEQE